MKNKIFSFIAIFISSVSLFSQAPNWGVSSSDYQYSMTMTAFLNVNGTTLTNANDKMGAFVGNQPRGEAKVVYNKKAKKYVAYLTFYSNTQGETVNFKIYDSTKNKVFVAAQTATFIVNDNLGGVFQSYSVASPSLQQVAKLASFSFKGIAAVSTNISRDAVRIVLPKGTSTRHLIPEFTTQSNGKVYQSKQLQVSGTVATDFTNGVVYEVLSEDESVLSKYTVRVSVAKNANPTTATLSASNEYVNSKEFAISVDFANDITGLTKDDFTITNGIVKNIVASSNKKFSASIVAFNQGNVTIQLPANKTTDIDSNGNLASNKVTVTYDTVKPILTNISSNGSEFTVVFSEDVQNVSKSDFELLGIAKEGYKIGSLQSVSASTYKVNLTDLNTEKGNVYVGLKATSGITDRANNIVESQNFEMYYIDNVSVFWQGSTNTNWNTVSNWSGGAVPKASDKVIIKAGGTHMPIIEDIGVSLKELLIQKGSSLTVKNKATLQVSNGVIGNITYKRSLLSNKWHLVGVPVLGATYNDAWIANNNIASGTGANRGIGVYQNVKPTATTTGIWQYFKAGSSSANFTNGKGYVLMRGSSDGDVSFTGVYTNKNVSFKLAKGRGSTYGGDDYNLLGNPYLAFINSKTFLTNETNNLVSETIWLWNDKRGVYETKVTANDFKIAPGQGFFVRANTTNNVTFTKAMQSNEATDTFQKTKRVEIKLEVSNSTKSRYTELYYINGTTTGFDNGYDGELFEGTSYNFALFTDLVSSNGEKYAIQSLPNKDYENMIVPLGVISEANKEITFSAQANNLPNNLQVYLEDRVLGKFINISKGNYKVTFSKALNGLGRFYIHTSSKALSVGEVSSITGVELFKNKNTLEIIGLSNINTNVSLYTIDGKLVFQKNILGANKSVLTLPKVATGIYLVRLKTRKGVFNKKILFNQ